MDQVLFHSDSASLLPITNKAHVIWQILYCGEISKKNKLFHNKFSKFEFQNNNIAFHNRSSKFEFQIIACHNKSSRFVFQNKNS